MTEEEGDNMLENPASPDSEFVEQKKSDYDNIFEVRRPIYCLQKFNQDYEENINVKRLYTRIFENLKKKANCAYFLNGLLSFVPFFTILKSFYKKSYIINDIIAGCTTCIFHIPQGLAYGLLAGLMPVNGLYTSFFPSLVYVFMGTSRHLSMGTFSLMSLMIRDPVDRVSAQLLQKDGILLNNTGSCSANNCTGNQTANSQYEELDLQYRIQVAIVVTLLAGLIQMLLGICHLGFINKYLSDHMVEGFTFSASIHVFTSQVTTVLGISIKRFSGPGKIIFTYIEVFSNLYQVNWGTVVTSLICIVTLIVVKEYVDPPFRKKLKMPIPIELILVLLATLISFLANLNDAFAIKIVGQVPRGFPTPIVPDLPKISQSVMAESFSIAIVGFAVSASLSKIFSLKFKYQCDYNQELVALGASNVVGSFFQCHFASGALARTSVVVSVGMKSQLASLLSCLLMVVILLAAGPVFEPVPKCVLSAIIMVSLKGMFKQILNLREIWKVSGIDCSIWVVTALAVIFMDVTFGLLIGFVFSLLTVIFRTQRAEARLLGRIPNTEMYKDTKVYAEAAEVPGIAVFRYDGSPYFANAEYLRDSLYRLTTNPLKGEDDSTDASYLHSSLHHIVLDCSTWAFIDSVGVRILKEIITTYRAVGVTVYVAYVKADVRDMFTRLKLFDTLESDCFFVSVHDAVLDAERCWRQQLTDAEAANQEDVV